MRKLLLSGLLAAGTLLPASPAFAYEGPWCAIIDQGAGFIEELCSMQSYEMCRAEARRWGPTAHCRQNGRYPGYSNQYRVILEAQPRFQRDPNALSRAAAPEPPRKRVKRSRRY